MSRSNRKGRTRTGPRFVQLFYFVMDSPAYIALRPGPRALLLEMIRRYNGANNGRIGMGHRDAQRLLGIADRTTMAGYFKALEDHGFIRMTKDSGFNMKLADERTAREWELTMFQVGTSPAARTFERWQPPVEARASRVGKSDQTRAENPTVVPFANHKRVALRSEKPTSNAAIGG